MLRTYETDSEGEGKETMEICLSLSPVGQLLIVKIYVKVEMKQEMVFEMEPKN